MSDFKHRFEKKLEGILEGKNDNAIIPSLEKRDNWVKVLLAKENRTNLYYNLKKRYEVKSFKSGAAGQTY